MPEDRPISHRPLRSTDVAVRVTVLDPRVEDGPLARSVVCRLAVESVRPLPTLPYLGTVRVGGALETATGVYPVRLLKHFAIEPMDAAAPGLVVYRLSVDVSDEYPGPPTGLYAPSRSRPRLVTEPIETVCKRVAGLFARHCEDFRPPSVAVRLEP
jgi:hypothetical protein